MRALVSVSDKTGLVPFVKGLVDLGWEIIATGGTQKLLEKEGVKTIGISEVTGFPEICDGRVKTLEYAWYFGLFHAWSQRPGTLWSVPLPSGFSGIGVRFKVRPGSEVSPSGAGGAAATVPAAAGKSASPRR